MLNITKTFLDKEIVEHRKEICDVCIEKKLGICMKCGCIIESKVQLGVASCPIGKWDSVEKTLTTSN